MSMVTVHGPYTMYSKAVVQAGAVMAVVDPANGLKWDFKLSGPTTRPDQDFSWAFPTDGTPTPQLLADPAVVTYGTAGSKTATLTVSNTSRTVSNKALTSNVATLTTTVAHGFKVGQVVTITGVDATFNGTYTIASTPSGTTFTYALVAANVGSAASGGTVASATSQVPAAGTYPMTITAVAGVAPLETQTMSEEPPPEEPAPEEPPPEDAYDPNAPNQDYALEVGYDPAAHTVTEVIGYVEDNPDQLDDIVAAEQAGKGRVTLLTHLESMRPA